MKVLGIRFCQVSSEAQAMAGTLEKLGLNQRDLGVDASQGFQGAVFPVGEEATGTWVEFWPSGEGMPEGVMLQIVVDDADAFAEHAKSNDLDVQGPHDAHGERIYFFKAPGGLQVSFQSKLAD